MSKLLTCTGLAFLFSLTALGQVPDSIAYQGYLTDNLGVPLNGTVNLRFYLYNTLEDGTTFWDDDHIGVAVNEGFFNLYLGTHTPIADIPFDRPLFLGMRVNGGAEMTPRTPLVPAPYALGLRGVRVYPTTSDDAPNIIGGHVDNTVADLVKGATIGGGGRSPAVPGPVVETNNINGDYGTVGGGVGNSAASYGTVGGGSQNESSGEGSSIGGGGRNMAIGQYATIGGGGPHVSHPDTGNFVNGKFGTVGGGAWNEVRTGHYAADFGTVGGGFGNRVRRSRATIAGGNENLATGLYTAIGGGDMNKALGDHSSVGGGDSNEAQGPLSAIGGGAENITMNSWATIAGGRENQATNNSAAVAGGWDNDATGEYSAVGGGRGNVASGIHSVIPGGFENSAQGDNSFAAGSNASAYYDGSFVWSDERPFTFTSYTTNSFNVRATGGMKVVLAIDGAGASTWACTLNPSSSWSCSSDRALKTNVVPTDQLDVLEKVVSLPLNTWSAKGGNPGIRHMGPMAQDFYALFGLGDSDVSISTIDLDGVSLSAIQGLYQLVTEQRAEIDVLRKEMIELRAAFR